MLVALLTNIRYESDGYILPRSLQGQHHHPHQFEHEHKDIHHGYHHFINTTLLSSYSDVIISNYHIHMFPAATPQYIWPSYKISHRVAPLHGPHYLRPAYKCPILSTKGQRKWKYKYFPLQILVNLFTFYPFH